LLPARDIPLRRPSCAFFLAIISNRSPRAALCVQFFFQAARLVT
jgi:hypothetical protein